MFRVRKAALIIGLLAFLGVAQFAAWQLFARDALPLELPGMLRQGLLNYEARMSPYNVWPKSVHVVLDSSVPESVAQRADDFKRAYSPAKVKMSTEREARGAGTLVGWRCQNCTVVSYVEERNNPVFARVEVSLGGEHAVGYDHWYLHVLGRWVHVRTRFLWIT